MCREKLRQELEHCEQFFQANQKELFEAIIEEETESGKRIIIEDDLFAIFAAYAGRFAYETWIVPRDAGAHFDRATPQQIKHCARLLRARHSQFPFSLREKRITISFCILPPSMMLARKITAGILNFSHAQLVLRGLNGGLGAL